MHFPVRVYYEDTDAGSIVYHANYLHFLERARTEFLRQGGISQQQLFEKSLAFVVKKVEIDYKFPARLDDLLDILTEVIELRRAKVILSQSIWKENICLVQAKVVIACVNLDNLKPMAIPNEIYQLFKI